MVENSKTGPMNVEHEVRPGERSRETSWRFNVRVPVRISTIDPAIDLETGTPYFQTCEEACSNISRGGIFVATTEVIEPGRRLLVEVEIPEGGTLQSIGQVVWRRIGIPGASPSPAARPGIGIRFTGGRPGQFVELERYLLQIAARRKNLAGSEQTRQPQV